MGGLLSLKVCRALLGDAAKDLDSEELSILRDDMYSLCEVTVAAYVDLKEKAESLDSSCPVDLVLNALKGDADWDSDDDYGDEEVADEEKD